MKIHSMDLFKIFIVEDDLWYSELLKYHLSRNQEYIVEKFNTGKEFLHNLYKNPSVVTLDYGLPDVSCQEVMASIWKYNPEIPIVIVSGQEDISTAVNLLKEGVYDYIVKDDETKNRLWNTIKNIRNNLALKTKIQTLQSEVQQKYEVSKIIKGSSDAIHKVFKLIEKATKSNITVSISGETGTGKELVAKAIHYNSPRASEAFVAINVAAIPSELIESELFGYEKGAFTGAVSRRIGKFEQANNGTLLLDEIAEMDLSLQAKLLRVLQEKELTRIGGNDKIKTDARIITASHKNLLEEVRKGNFREDLYFRILGLPIELPPLRERGNDIILLANYFIDMFCAENKMEAKSLTPKAKAKLLRYHFSGNIRELKAISELSVVMSDDTIIDEEHIQFNENSQIDDFLSKERSLKEYEDIIIKHYLKKYAQNIQVVAQKLDIGKSTLYRLVKDRHLITDS